MKLLFGIVVLLIFVFSFSVSAYNQDNTHPALTDEIVDFYNLFYPDELISEEFKREMIRGSIEEDEDIRALNHFYDPIYNKGFTNYSSSKEWAINSEHQQWNLAKYASIFELPPSSLKNTSYGNYSYEQAIKDYAMGDKKRALRALGHVLHLLEDANVPGHTRDDPHPPLGSAFGSPYESEMAKWSPLNTSIAKPLFDKKVRPIIFNDVGRYFDEVAFYSNNNFFSEDTIFSDRYVKPSRFFGKEENGRKYIFGFDKDNSTFRLAVVGKKHARNFTENKILTINDELVLNDYWSRLSKQLVPYGAGFVRVFLAQAKAAEKLYAEQKIEEPKQNFFQKLISAINPFGGNDASEIQNEQLASDIASSIVNGEIAEDIQGEPISEGRDNISIFENLNIPILPLPLLVTSTPSPAVSPAPSQTVTPSPSKTPTPTLTSTPIPSVSPTPTKTPSPMPSLGTTGAPGSVVINEITWAGTQASQYGEWIELYNTTGNSVDLSGWAIFEAGGDTKVITLEGVIGPTGYFLIERATPSSPDAITDITADVSGSFGGAGLNNSGEYLVLKDAAGNTIDSVNALAGWFAGDKDTKSSMERKNANVSGNDQTNWQTNSGVTKNGRDADGNPINGTPKKINSIY